MKENEIIERRFHGKAPDHIYEVYDTTDKEHSICICSVTDRGEAVRLALNYSETFGVPFSCLECYELTKVENITKEESVENI